MCISNPSTISETYEKASAIYLVAISKVEAININAGRADLDIEFTVLITYKGKATGKLKGIGSRYFPTLIDGDNYQSKVSTCDTSYHVGQEFLVALFGDEDIRFIQCSHNVLSMSEENLKKLAVLSASNK